MKGLTFSEPMVKQWFAGNKTITRRLMNPQPGFWVGVVPYRGNIGDSNHDVEIKPPYRPGETVYIRETWAVDKKYNHLPPSKIPIEGRRPVYYKALYDDEYANAEKPPNLGRWRSPRFMPEWASRSHALIGSVRPERIREITEEEAVKEGIGAGFQMNSGWPDYQHIENGICTLTQDNAVASFVSLWESLHPGSWERNDFVFRIELKKV